MKHPHPNNNYVQQPPFNTNYMQQLMQNPKDISNSITEIDMALVLMAKAVKLNNTTPTNNNQRSSSNPRNMQIAQPGMNMDQDRQMLMVEDNVGNQFRPNAQQIARNQNGYNAVQNVGNQLRHNAVQNSNIQKTTNQSRNVNVVAVRAKAIGNGNNENQIRCYNCQGVNDYGGNCTVNPRKRDIVYLQTQLQIALKEEAGMQLNYEEFNFTAAAGAYDEIKEVNTNYTLQDNLQQASTLGTLTDSSPIYDLDGSAEVHHVENCYDNDIFNMFTQEEQYTELLKPINEPQPVQQNTSNVILAKPSMEHNGGTVEQKHVTVEETHDYFESLYNNLVSKVEKVNTVNRKIRETNADLTTELARYKGQEKCFEFNQAKFDELENGYRKVLLEKHDPPTVYDSEETLQLAQESRLKMKQLNKDIKPENYAKINKISKIFVSEKAKSREEVYFSNTSKLASVSNTISKPFSIPDDECSIDTLSVAWKFLNEVKDTIVTLQSVIKHRMNANITNWSSPSYQEFHKIIKEEIAPIVNQVDARVQNFENYFVKEATKFVRDFKSLAKAVDESLHKITILEKENERLLRAVVS
ncbi:hypothetical protein Tco_0711092 [Tanacetum coccineum]